MSRTINEVHLLGRAGKDAENKHTSTGKTVTKFSLATGGGKKRGSDTERWPTDWHTIEVWDNENAQIVEKGMEIEVVGRLKYEEWEDKKTGGKRYGVKIVANSVAFPGEAQVPSGPAKTQCANDNITDEDIPF